MNLRQYRQNNIGTILAVSATMFVLTLSAFDSIGFVPSYIDGIATPHAIAETQDAQPTHAQSAPVPVLNTPAGMVDTAPIFPTRIVAYSIGLDFPVSNPESTDADVLDNALLSGPVRYPLSAKLNQDGNILIFAHTSHVAIVHNHMYKAFNHISELQKGDTLKLEGDGKAYIYRVTNVREANADEVMVDLSPTQGKKLTLSTCDTLTGKSARFVVEADFIGAYEE